MDRRLPAVKHRTALALVRIASIYPTPRPPSIRYHARRYASNDSPSAGSSSSPTRDTAVRLSRASNAPLSAPSTNPAANLSKDISHPARMSTGLEIHRRMNALLTQASASFETIGGKLNRLTGYDEIEGLKVQVREREEAIARLQQAARAAKREYEAAVYARSACQREVNDLLQRKSMWSEVDVSRFTDLVRQDHLNEQAELNAKGAVGKAEEDVEKGQTELMQTILHRYHEEQVWSDKIRSASTYGSLIALGLNLVVFVLAVIAVEPWKRKRLAQTFEKRVVEMTGEMEGVVKHEVRSMTGRLDEMEVLLARVVSAGAPTAGPVKTILPPTREAATQVHTPGLNESQIPAGEDSSPPETADQDWKSLLAGTWHTIRTRALQDEQLAVVAVGGAALGALTTGLVSFTVWTMRNR